MWRTDTYKLLLAYLFLIVSGCTEFDESSETIGKRVFEHQTSLFLWDSGSSPGGLDEGDRIVDLTVGCGSLPTYYEALKLHPMRRQSVTGDSPVDQVLQRMLGEEIFKEFGSMVSQYFILGHFAQERSPVFIVIPEFHLFAAGSDRELLLHNSLSRHVLTLAEVLVGSGLRMGNMYEAGQTLGKSTPLSSKAYRDSSNTMPPLERVWQALDSSTITYPHSLGLAFGEDSWPHYLEQDGGLDTTLGITIAAAYLRAIDLAPKLSLEDFLKQLPHELTARSRQHLERVIAETIALGKEQALKLDRENCRRRTELMAENGMKFSKPYDVVFVGLGVRHVPGFLKNLERNQVSYLVFSAPSQSPFE